MIYAHTGEALQDTYKVMIDPISKTATIVDTPHTQPKPQMNDPVNRPKHYTFGYFEVIEVLQDWFPKNPLLWQVGKYIARADHKGKPLEDLRKARYYLQREIDRLEDLSENQKPEQN
jgi:hypothetical protein